MVATATNFAELFAINPYVLHFSGHGVKVHENLKGNAKSDETEEGGDYLVIEDGSCGGQELNQKKLKDLLEKAELDIQVAVVLSCHSEYIGRIFLKAGIKHVICVGRQFEIKDKACIIFASAFYNHLFSTQTDSVCKAFEFAQKSVATQFGKEGCQGEEGKFKCLHEHNEKCHSTGILPKKGFAINTSTKVHIKELPVRVPDLVGRNSDCIELLNLLSENSPIWIEGIPGIGKSALAKEVAHLAYERDIFEDGVLYMSVKDCQLFEGLLEKFFFRTMEGLREASKQAELEKYINASVSEKYKKCLRMIRNLKLLIILDNCDRILTSEEKHFQKFIEDVSQKLENSRIMITSAAANSDFVSQGGYVYKLDRLSDKYVLELLRIPMKNRLQNKELKTEDSKSLEKTVDFEHELFKMLNGHPLSILLVASLQNDTSLTEVYKTLSRLRKQQGIRSDMSGLIFTLSIEASLAYVKKQNKDAYQMLLYFALCPSGLTRQD